MGMITRVEVDKKHADVEPTDYGYIWFKSDFVLKHMKGPNAVVDPTTKKMRSYQYAFYSLVTADELWANYLWWYKPEVTFSMPGKAARMKRVPAVPHLIAKYVKVADRTDDNCNYGKNRRHTPSWKSKIVLSSENNVNAYRRRPDLIIVEDHSIRWPGTAIESEDSIYESEYDDNIKRLVEMKFPKDEYHRGQEEDYQYICGIDRFSSLWITEDDNRKNQENTYEFSPDLVPIFAKERLPNAHKLETWVYNNYHPVNLLSEDKIKQDLSVYFRSETLEQLKKDTPWLFTTGEFTLSEKGEYSFVPDDGGKALTYSQAELQKSWDEIRTGADITDDQLNTNSQNSDDAVQLPTIVVSAKAQTGMSTGDKIILGLEIASTVAMFIPGVNIGAGALRAGLFLLRIAKAAKFAPKVARGLEGIFSVGKQVAPAL